jgi:hypothetical protein
MPPAGSAGKVTRSLVAGLFVASCLLSAVSWFTTNEGMRLYLAYWFAIVASLGLQAALVLVAWLIGLSKAKRVLLGTVYVITATVSIAFSYMSLYTWFSARERPATIQRKLYDTLADAAGRAESTLSAAAAEGQKHVLALQELTIAEKTSGYVSRAQDTDPYLAKVREAVALEAKTYRANYREGAGEGVRYTAFTRYVELAEQAVERIGEARKALAAFQAHTKPLDSTEDQLRAFRQAYNAIPWTDVEEQLHAVKLNRAAIPAYSDFVDHSASSQEDLILAFKGLFTAPTTTHISALALAAFIDCVVFLLAFAAGPHFAGSPHRLWLRAGAVLDGKSEHAFTADFLRKLDFTSGETALNVKGPTLSVGERHVFALLAATGMAKRGIEKDNWLLDTRMEGFLLDSLATHYQPPQETPAAPDIQRELDFVAGRPQADQLRLARMLRPVIGSYLAAARAAKDLATETAILEIRTERDIHLASCISALTAQVEQSRLVHDAKADLEEYLNTTAYERTFEYATNKEE